MKDFEAMCIYIIYYIYSHLLLSSIECCILLIESALSYRYKLLYNNIQLLNKFYSCLHIIITHCAIYGSIVSIIIYSYYRTTMEERLRIRTA